MIADTENRVIMAYDLYCCLLPQCEALHTCHSGFPITTKWCCDQDVKVVPGAAFTKRTILLRSESPSSKCAELHTVAASNNRDHAPDHSIIACLHYICMGVIFRAPPVCGESHIQCNGTREVATVQHYIRHLLRRIIESNPGQGLVKYECVVTCTCPQTNTVASGHLVTK